MRIKWLLFGNIIYALGQWLILVLLTRFYSSEEVGHYFFALSFVTPIALILSLKLPNLVVTLEKDFTNEVNVIFVRNLITLIIIILSCTLYFIFFQSNTTFKLLTTVIIYKIMEQNDDIKIAYLQKDYLFKEIFLIKSIRTFIYVSLVFIFSLIFDSLELSLLIATLIYSIYWIAKNKNYIYISPFSLHYIYLKTYIKNGIHLSLSSSLSSLGSSGIRLYVGYNLGSSALAIYGVISYSQTAFSLIVSALGQYFLPHFVKNSKNYRQLKKYILKSQLFIISISLLCIVISYFLGSFLLSIFYGSEYEQYGFFLTLIFVAALFKSSCSLIGTAMTAIRIYNFQLKFTIISLVLVCIFLPILINKYGAFGAYYGVVLINIIEWLLYIIYSKKIFSVLK